MRPRRLILLAIGPVIAACEGSSKEAPVVPEASSVKLFAEQQELPFHARIVWQAVQLPLAAGRCTGSLPPGMSYLWMTQLSGTAIGTHVGEGSFDGSICIYGQLTDPAAEPPGNGIPAGWRDGLIVLTAANGDRLHLTVWSTGFTAPPGTPGWQFTEAGTFVDGGSGRFVHAAGEFTGVVDPVAQTAVYDGSIRFGAK